MLYMATGKPAHLGCKFLLDVSVANSPIVVELLVILSCSVSCCLLNDATSNVLRFYSPQWLYSTCFG